MDTVRSEAAEEWTEWKKWKRTEREDVNKSEAGRQAEGKKVEIVS